MPAQAIGRDPLRAAQFRTQRPENPEDLWQMLYDRMNLATTVPNTVSFFSIPRGQSTTLITASAAAAKNKTYRDTNMEAANVVPAKLFQFQGISIGFVHSTRNAVANAADKDFVRDGGYLQFRVIDKDILYAPLIAIPEVNPLMAAATTVTASTINSHVVGGGNMPMYRFPIPITLNPNENFTVTLNFDGTITLTGTLDLYVIFHGFMRRPT